MADYPASFSQHFQESELPKLLGEIYSRFESDRNVIVPSIVRNFIGIAITESFYLERQASVETCLSTVSSILVEAREIPYEGTKYVSLIGVVEQIHSKWCRVRPFC